MNQVANNTWPSFLAITAFLSFVLMKMCCWLYEVNTSSRKLCSSARRHRLLNLLFLNLLIHSFFLFLLILRLILLVSERSDRDTLRGSTIENRECLFVYIMFECTQVIFVL